jgi:hypothetical protein
MPSFVYEAALCAYGRSVVDPARNRMAFLKDCVLAVAQRIGKGLRRRNPE